VQKRCSTAVKNAVEQRFAPVTAATVSTQSRLLKLLLESLIQQPPVAFLAPLRAAKSTL
jgi:hypothetical protein